MIGEDSVKVFYERADCLLECRDKLNVDKNKIAKDKIKLEMKYNKVLAKSREVEAQYKILVEAIKLVEPLFKKKGLKNSS